MSMPYRGLEQEAAYHNKTHIGIAESMDQTSAYRSPVDLSLHAILPHIVDPAPYSER